MDVVFVKVRWTARYIFIVDIDVIKFIILFVEIVFFMFRVIRIDISDISIGFFWI